jgi:hypothetical protein
MISLAALEKITHYPRQHDKPTCQMKNVLFLVMYNLTMLG